MAVDPVRRRQVPASPAPAQVGGDEPVVGAEVGADEPVAQVVRGDPVRGDHERALVAPHPHREVAAVDGDTPHAVRHAVSSISVEANSTGRSMCGLWPQSG